MSFAFTMMQLEEFQRLIKAACGLAFHEDKISLLIAGLKERMTATGLTADSYLQLFKKSAAEQAELIDLITINESYFFREPEQIELLVKRLVPDILTRAPDSQVRILSLGCSRGEEPYSIAMALEQAHGPQMLERALIQGTDIDRKALELARQGIYSDFAFRGLAPGLVETYFIDLGANRYQILPGIRTRLTFLQLNLLASEWPEGLQNQDVIFFRNVSIYFDEPTRRAIQGQIAKALRPGGFLFMSATETLSNDFGIMQLEQKADVFFFRNQQPVANHRTSLAHQGQQDNRPSQPSLDVRFVEIPHAQQRPALDLEKLSAQALAQAKDGLLDEAIALSVHLCGLPEAKSHHYRLLASLYFLKEDFDKAKHAILAALQEDDLEPASLFLLAQIQRWQGLHQEAIDCLKKVIYSLPDHWQAHFVLGECQRQLGHEAAAKRSYQRLLHILKGPPAPSTDSITPLIELPAGKIKLLAERRLANDA